MVGRVPEMGRCAGPETCRGWGQGAGAENREVWRARVSVHAGDGRVVAAPRGVQWQVWMGKKDANHARTETGGAVLPSADGRYGSPLRSHLRYDGTSRGQRVTGRRRMAVTPARWRSDPRGHAARGAPPSGPVSPWKMPSGAGGPVTPEWREEPLPSPSSWRTRLLGLCFWAVSRVFWGGFTNASS